MRVLHVDDDRETLKLVRLMLKGFDYFSVTSVKDALDLLRLKRFDVLILDLKFNDELVVYDELGGIKLLKILTGMRFKPARIVLLTALSSEALKAKSEFPIVSSIVNKPFLKKQLLEAINDSF